MSNSNSNKNYTLYFFLIAIIVGIIWGKGPFKKLQKDELHSNANKPSFNDKNKIDIDSAFLKSYIRSKLLLSLTIKAQNVKIGTQTWTSKNLNVGTYRNGDKIPQVQDKNAWAKLKTGAWCYYENKTANGKIFGKLYNWYAVNDPRGLAPKGYHIPTHEEWTILSDYLGEESEAGTKMKSITGWKNNGNGTNTSGFSGQPGGGRDANGDFDDIGASGLWWSASEFGTDGAWPRGLNGSNGNLDGDGFDNRSGMSVRCIID